MVSESKVKFVLLFRWTVFFVALDMNSIYFFQLDCVNDEGLLILFPGVKLRQSRQCQDSYAASIMKTKPVK